MCMHSSTGACGTKLSISYTLADMEYTIGYAIITS